VPKSKKAVTKKKPKPKATAKVKAKPAPRAKAASKAKKRPAAKKPDALDTKVDPRVAAAIALALEAEAEHDARTQANQPSAWAAAGRIRRMQTTVR
jgi:hypothetical protein